MVQIKHVKGKKPQHQHSLVSQLRLDRTYQSTAAPSANDDVSDVDEQDDLKQNSKQGKNKDKRGRQDDQLSAGKKRSARQMVDQEEEADPEEDEEMLSNSALRGQDARRIMETAAKQRRELQAEDEQHNVAVRNKKIRMEQDSDADEEDEDDFVGREEDVQVDWKSKLSAEELALLEAMEAEQQPDAEESTSAMDILSRMQASSQQDEDEEDDSEDEEEDQKKSAQEKQSQPSELSPRLLEVYQKVATAASASESILTATAGQVTSETRQQHCGIKGLNSLA